ncbi:MAG TPA: hypothetical protein VEX18_14170, partial [Polyangiaceae bacterium]|nr:hypothetical protein [Polyangiaceae bacterium]
MLQQTVCRFSFLVLWEKARASPLRKQGFLSLPSTRRLRLTALAALALVVGCKNRSGADASATASASASSRAASVARAVAGAELDGATAFTLVARAGGLRLLWASPQAAAGWLHELELSKEGQPAASARRLALPAR